MNEDVLDAECVINHLANLNIIKVHTWQNPSPNDQDLSVFFEIPGRAGNIGLQIIKRSGCYYIHRSRIAILAHRYGFDADTICTYCAVKPM
jgi:hypothetical protein